MRRLCSPAIVISSLTFVIQVFSTTVTFHDFEQETFMHSLDWWEVSHPVIVNYEGAFKSHHLHYTVSNKRNKRSIADEKVHYQLTVNGQKLHLELLPNLQLYSPNLAIERRDGNGNHSVTAPAMLCHFTGKIRGILKSTVALATCNGLTGVIMTPNGHYFVEPLKGHQISPETPHPHLVYRAAHQHEPSERKDLQGHSYKTSEENSGSISDYCSAQGEGGRDDLNVHRRFKRSVSKDNYVEALVVVDHAMVMYYENEDINTYIMTIMNMVSVMFHDASLGNSVEIVLVKMLLLDKEQEELEGLKITHHADNTLASFCKWQNTINPHEPDPTHHDVAILLTRTNICSGVNEPCATLGLSQVSGMCQPERACNVNQDTGLALAYTVAHEIGHNLGMKHDGLTSCNVVDGEKSFIMFPEFLMDAGRPLEWSNCSRAAITKFLDRGWGFCLSDEPKEPYSYIYPSKPPGLMYDVNHQCRLQYGEGAEHCDGIENLCTTLWCRVNNNCVTKLEPSAEGTICKWKNTTNGEAIAEKWCFDGGCIAIGERPTAIDGNWASWAEWTECSRTCGGGVSYTERHCTNPVPSHGGNFCLGERRRNRICNTKDCNPEQPSFRQIQCSEYNNRKYNNKIYEWVAVETNNPCQLNCKPKNDYFSVMLNDMVKDGTPCLPGTRNMCISGRCRRVACDWKIDSNATEDRCGVCHGDGNSCKMIKDQFKGQQGRGYVEAGTIPAGARNIRIEEVAAANNYLAIKSGNGQYYLNGHWYIQWSGNYNAAGTVMSYERSGNKEGITAPGPIKEPLVVMVLFQSHNPGVIFEYTVPNLNGSNSTRHVQFSWVYLDWSHCTVSCGGGIQRSKVVCQEKVTGVVDDFYCKNQTKPDDRTSRCNEHTCPARWWTGPWQHCSVSCGHGGTHRRTVLCVRSLGPEEQMALDDNDCEQLPKPEATKPCTTQPICPDLWRTGPWSECAEACDTQTRDVICTSANVHVCHSMEKPESVRPCSKVNCGYWTADEVWSECSKPCGGGVRYRTVTCVNGKFCLQRDRPDDFASCNEWACGNRRLGVTMRNEIPEFTRRIYNRFENNYVDDWSEKNQITTVTSTTRPATTLSEQARKPKTFWKQLWSYVVGPNQGGKNTQWRTENWSQCSATCGSGQRNRHVWCLSKNKCDINIKPHHTEPCNVQSCVDWVAGSWSQCSVSCGSGTQARNVQCIDLQTDSTSENCDIAAKPKPERECNAKKCDTISAALKKWSLGKCTADTLARETCQQLKDRGFCSFRYVLKNCCKMCEES